MGMDLEGAGGYYRWSGGSWGQLLDMAIENGWEPTKTGPPRGTPAAEWNGNYWSNDGQLFYARDAKKFADALQAALTKLLTEPDEERRQEVVAPLVTHEAINYFATAEGKKALGEFIAYCYKGSFRIY